MNARVKSRAAHLFVMCALFLTALLGFGNLSVAPQAQAAISNKCDGTAANDQNSLRVTPNHGAVFYIDSGQGQSLDATYVSYSVNNRAISSRTNLWVKVDTFTGGKVQLANTNDSSYPLGDVAASGTSTSFFLLKATATTTSAQSHVVRVYSGKPGLTSSTELYSCSYSFTKVAETIKAAANKVTSITNTSVTAVGATMTVTVKGNTGTIGAGNATDGSVMWFSPSARSAWPTQSLRLEGTSIQFYKNSARTQSAGSAFSNKLRITLSELQTAASAPNDKSFYYDAIYTYRILGAASIAADLTPVAQIASGTQMKHTDVGSIASAGTTSISVSSPTVNLSVTKSVSSTATISNGETNFRYTISLANTGASALSVDQVTDDPDNSLAYRAGTATFNSSSILDPSWSADGTNLIFSGPFAVPANTTRTIVYDLYIGTCSSGSYSYANSATATVGSTIIGSGATTMSVTSASGTCGSTSVTASTTTTTLPIEVDTDIATVTGNTTATIYGLVDPNGDSGSTVFFDYGTSPTLATYTRTNVGSTNSQTTSYSVNKALTGLTSGTIYYYRVGAGTTLGSILSFVTTEPAANPTATTGSVSGMTLVSSKIDLTLSGTVDPNQITNGTKVTFQYATDSSGGSCSGLGTAVNVPSSGFLQDDVSADVVLSGAFPTEVNTGALVTGLTNNTYYCFKIRGWYNSSSANWSTSVDGSWVSFLAKVRLSQSISYPVPNTMVVDEVQSTSATATSGLAVSYSSNTPDICTVNASTGAVTGVSAGTCSITASQPGNNNYDPATDVTVFFTVDPLPPIITNTSLASGTIQSSYTETLNASLGNGTYTNWTLTSGPLPAGLTLNSSTGVISGTPTAGGTYSVTFTVDSGTQTSVTKTLSIVIDKLPQTITFATPQNSQISDATKSIAATTDAPGLDVTLSSNTTSVCTVAASPTTSPFTVNLVGQGTCELVASQSGNSTYDAATNLTHQFLVTGSSFTLTFDSNNSFSGVPTTGNAPASVTSNAIWEAAGNTGTPAMEKAGYAFGGWTENADGTGASYDAGDLLSLSADTTVFAKWSLIAYTITYKDTNSTGGSVPNATVGFGGLNLSSNSGAMARTNYYLEGWTINGVDYALGDSYTLNADVDAEPIWSQYTLTYLDTNATSGAAPSAQNGVGSVSLAGNTGSLTRSNYYLAGWTINGVNFALNSSFNLTADETAAPRWAQYAITFISPGTTTGSTPANTNAVGSYVLPSNSGNLTRSGYDFGGWLIDNVTYLSGDTITVSKNTNIFAKWLRCSLTYSAPAKSSGALPRTAVGCNTVTIARNPGSISRNGYFLAGWSINGVDYNFGDSFTVTSAHTANAIWQRYAITYLSAEATGGTVPTNTFGSGNVSLAGNSGNLVRENYYFAGWYLGSSPYATGATYNLRANIFAFANWQQYKITYKTTGAESGAIPADAISLGFRSIPVASPGTLFKSGYLFAGWNIGGVTYQPRDTFDLTGNVDAEPVWAQCKITYNGQLSDSGTTPTETLGCANTLATQGSLSRRNFYFAGWSIDGQTYQPGDTTTITGNRTAYAIWKKYTMSFIGTGADSGAVPTNVFHFGNLTIPRAAGTLAKAGYYVSGWTINGVDYRFGSTYTLNSDVVATPIWSQYTITYSSIPSYTGSLPALTSGFGTTKLASLSGVTPLPTRAGFVFGGWVIGGTVYQEDANYNLTGNVTAFVRWVRNR